MWTVHTLRPCEQDGVLLLWLCSSNPQPQFNHEKSTKQAYSNSETKTKTIMIIKNKEGLRKIPEKVSVVTYRGRWISTSSKQAWSI